MMDILLQDKVLKTIKKYDLISQGDKIVVGVSGGPDSICLLHVLFNIMKTLNSELYVFHLNHMLRGDEADMEEEYVTGFCNKLKIPIMKKSIDVGKISEELGLSIEETAREIRYKEFNAYAETVGACKVAVAHNKNDQAETILMRIIRGTGLEGLTGMDYKRDNIIRPLLDISRNEIEEYCNKYSLEPKIDSSNMKSIYTRNKIRLELIPHIDKMFGGNLTESLCRMSDILKEDNRFLEKTVTEFYQQVLIKKDGKNILINNEELKLHHIASIKRIIRIAISQVKGNLKCIESSHLEAAAELVLNGKTGSRICLPDKVFVEKSYNTLKIGQNFINKSIEKFEEEINIPGITYIHNINSSIEATVFEQTKGVNCYKNPDSSSYSQYFDCEKINGGINIRNRKPGDVFKPLKSIGTKKLKEFLIDDKIPREDRDGIPVLAKGNEVIWLVGYKISDKFKVTENTKCILKLEYKKNYVYLQEGLFWKA